MSFDITTSSPVLVVVGNSGGNVLTDAAMSSGSYNHTFTGNGQTLWYGFACTVNQTMQLDNIRLTKTTGHGYEAVVVKTADYYPYGMVMPERNHEYAAVDYRYAYNGMEQDNEAKGNGNSYTTEFRQYDPRLGRWLSLDPLMSKYPWMSPYAAFNNNPVFFVDPLGLEGGPAKEKLTLPEIDVTEKTNENSAPLSSHENNSPQNQFDLKINILNSTVFKSHSINIGTFERSKDLTLASGYGKPLTKEILLNHYKNNFCKTCTEGQLQNKTGLYFEKLFEEYLDREFSIAHRALIVKNTVKVEGDIDGEIKHSVPDYFGLMVSSKKLIPDAVNISSLYELKATKNNVGVGSFEGQLKIQIEYARKTKGKELVVITTSDIILTKNLRNYAISKGVTLTHYTANYTAYKHMMSISLKLKTY